MNAPNGDNKRRARLLLLAPERVMVSSQGQLTGQVQRNITAANEVSDCKQVEPLMIALIDTLWVSR